MRVTPAPNAPVVIQVMGEGFLESTRARDISLGGLALFIPHGIAADAFDARVKLIVTLPGQKAFVVHGTVRHTTQTGDRRFVGVAFEELEGRALELLTAYVESRTTTR